MRQQRFFGVVLHIQPAGERRCRQSDRVRLVVAAQTHLSSLRGPRRATNQLVGRKLVGGAAAYDHIRLVRAKRSVH